MNAPCLYYPHVCSYYSPCREYEHFNAYFQTLIFLDFNIFSTFLVGENDKLTKANLQYRVVF